MDQEHQPGAHPRDPHPLACEALCATVWILEQHSAHHGDLSVHSPFRAPRHRQPPLRDR